MPASALVSTRRCSLTGSSSGSDPSRGGSAETPSVNWLRDSRRIFAVTSRSAHWALLIASLEVPPPLAVAQQQRALALQQYLGAGGAALPQVGIPPSLVDWPRSCPPAQPVVPTVDSQARDRKSTRLNSSHDQIS